MTSNYFLSVLLQFMICATVTISFNIGSMEHWIFHAYRVSYIFPFGCILVLFNYFVGLICMILNYIEVIKLISHAIHIYKFISIYNMFSFFFFLCVYILSLSIWLRVELLQYQSNLKVFCICKGIMSYFGNKVYYLLLFQFSELQFIVFTCSYLRWAPNWVSHQALSQYLIQPLLILQWTSLILWFL